MRRAEAAGLPPLRVGLAAGEALNQGGDCERSGDERPARGRGAPVNLASRIASAATPGDILADEKVADHFHAPGDQLERLMYGWSIVHCLPVSLAEQPSAAIGTVIREDIVRTLARAAGFARVEVLPVDAGFFRLYRLRG